MAVYYGNLLSIIGPNLTEVLNSIKGGTCDGGNLAGPDIFLDPERLKDFYQQKKFEVCLDRQSIKTEADGSITIYFNSDPAAFFFTHSLSSLFPSNTFKLQWWLYPAPSIVLFRNGEASHVHGIPNYNTNTGKTATLFEICCSHLNTMHDGEELDQCIERALGVVQNVKMARLEPTEQAEGETNRTEELHDPNIMYSSELDREIVSQMQPLLYTCEMVPADEERIARLVADLRSMETADETIVTLKRQTGKDVNFIVPEQGSSVRFAILPCELAEAVVLPNEPVAVPIVRYTNADPVSQKYVPKEDGEMPAVEWEIGHMYLTRHDLRQLRWDLGEGDLDDADFIASWSPSVATMKHGGPKVPTFNFRLATKHAWWKRDPLVAQEVLKRFTSGA